MEIIPILAFIILVATIATFIFATAAYILYKIRESRGKVINHQPNHAFHAEFVTPEPMQPMGAAQQPEFQTSFHQNAPQARTSPQPASSDQRQEQRFMRYTSEGYIPVNKTKNGDSNQWQ